MNRSSQIRQVMSPVVTPIQAVHRNLPHIAMWLSLALICRITVFVRQRPDAKFTSIDSAALFQLIIVAFSCLLLFSISRKEELWRKIKQTSMIFLIYYYLISAFSCLWSPSLEYTIFRSVEYLSQIGLLIIVVSHGRDFYQTEKKVLLLCLAVIILGLFVNIKFFGLSSNLQDWHTNAYSTSAAMTFCYCLGEIFNPNRPRDRYLMICGGIAFLFLLLGTSTSSFLSVGIGVAFLVFMLEKQYVVITFFFILIALIYLLLAPDIGSQSDINWIRIGQDLKVLSPMHDDRVVWHLRGRAWLWEHYMEAVKQSPIYGHGFATFTRLFKFPSTNTHNGYFAALLGTGIIGLTVILVFIFRLLKESIRSTYENNPGSIGCILVFIVAAVNNMSISFIGEGWRAPSFVFIMFVSLHAFFVLLPQPLCANAASPRSQLWRRRVPNARLTPRSRRLWPHWREARDMHVNRPQPRQREGDWEPHSQQSGQAGRGGARPLFNPRFGVDGRRRP